MKLLGAALGVTLLAQAAPGGGTFPLNCPYPAEDEAKGYVYSNFDEPPKTLDPAVSYVANESLFMAQIYEPPLQYHFLKRPYELIPATLREVPRPEYFDAEGRPLPYDTPVEKVARAVYTCRLQPGIRYQDHPCFAQDTQGRLLYNPVDPALAARVESPLDFPVQATRELRAGDYVHGIRRLANPLLACPIRHTLAKYLLGMDAYSHAIAEEAKAERARRKAAAGAAYNQARDEQAHPLEIDLAKHPFPGVELVDDLTFRLVLKTKYPQILYWLAMPFFSPVPPEADAFYRQPALADRNLTLARWPVGTGPFFLSRFDENRVITLDRNPHFHEERYPSEGEPADAAKGLLEDAGKRLPLAERAVYVVEKEALPIWTKFLQGYYDASTIPAESFERAVSLSPEGSPQIAGEMAEKQIKMERTVSASVSYFAFNMRDPLVGGLDEKHCKLRQALGIAMDTDEFIQIFRNGRGIPAMGPIPPGIYGYREGAEAVNPFVFTWDEALKSPKRRPIEDAKRLLAEAGYPGGIGPDGKPLTIAFDNALTDATAQSVLQWMTRQWAQIGVVLESRTTDFNRFQEKVHAGNWQTLQWGWNADYPDPENFLFLFYGPNARGGGQGGENVANYANPEFDAMFRKVENMDNGPERMALILKLNAMLQHDAPWINAFYPVDFALYHGWTRNVKPNLMANNVLKYRRIDAASRAALRRAWNAPRWTPVLVALTSGLLLLIPAGIIIWRRQRGDA